MQPFSRARGVRRRHAARPQTRRPVGWDSASLRQRSSVAEPSLARHHLQRRTLRQQQSRHRPVLECLSVSSQFASLASPPGCVVGGKYRGRGFVDAALPDPASLLWTTLARCPPRRPSPASSTESDFWGPFIIGFGSSPSQCRPARTAAGQTRDLPVPVQRAYAHASVFDHAGSFGRSRSRVRTCCFPPCRQRQHPDKEYFRGSMAGLGAPLPTPRRRPRGRLRTARGQCGSLFLHRSGLAPPTPCRSPGAPTTILTWGLPAAPHRGH